MAVRRRFWLIATIVVTLNILLGFLNPDFYYLLIVVVPLILLGIYDTVQSQSNILRNYPVIGHLRFLLLSIRPQIQQYYIQGETDELPYSNEQRSLIYERAKRINDDTPFGTLRDVNAPGFEWLSHSLAPKKIPDHEMKVAVGGDDCSQPYVASRLNISAMSYGALGKKAVEALNLGAKLGEFAQNTGEGGLTEYHLKNGGDIFMQIGTGYFGVRDKKTGNFDPDLFIEKSTLPQVKMIEIKLSQGAKPAHGGVLPAAKVTREIADIRHVEQGQDCVSPPAHTAFSTPQGLLEFVAKLRILSGGKPVGFKLCIGVREEFMAICKAMLATKILPDFITVDGAEGGTGAAPVEFTDSIGMPISESLVFVHNCLVGCNVREKIKIIASAKIVTGFDIAKKFALGADMVNMARPMMFSLGCVQSRRCHTNRCPTGIATQNEQLMYALDIPEKAKRVRNFHDLTLKNFRDVLGAAGLDHPNKLLPKHIWRRVNSNEGVKSYDQLYRYLKPGELLQDNIDWEFAKEWHAASKDEFTLLEHIA